jgi:hypothetical protein
MSNTEKKIISIKNLSQKLWGSLPTHQRLVNRNWLKKVHACLKEGGMWMYPNEGLVFIKKGNGFVEK